MMVRNITAREFHGELFEIERIYTIVRRDKRCKHLHSHGYVYDLDVWTAMELWEMKLI